MNGKGGFDTLLPVRHFDVLGQRLVANSDHITSPDLLERGHV